MSFVLVSSSCAQILVTSGSDSSGGPLSLRDAIEEAKSGETIRFSEQLTASGLDITMGEIVIEKDLIIAGPSSDSLLTISGDLESRLFRIEEGAHLTLKNLRFTKGRILSGIGGAVLNQGELTIEDCQFIDCQAASGGAIAGAGTLSCARCLFEGNFAAPAPTIVSGGGAIFAEGQVILFQCTFQENATRGPQQGGGAIHSAGELFSTECLFVSNHSEESGGGILNTGKLRIIRTTFRENTSKDDGAGVLNRALSESSETFSQVNSSTFSNNHSGSDSGALHLSRWTTASLENCTLAYNTAADAGGAIENTLGTLTISSSTIAHNRAALRGGGLFTLGATEIENCILAGNMSSASFNDLQAFDGLPSAVFIATGANIVEAPGNSHLGSSDNAISGPANLLPLANYGGQTQTMPPHIDSPALNAAIDSTHLNDQRGLTRFADGSPDLGAVEFLGVANEPYFDSDLDGISNGVELITGTDPLAADPAHPNHLRIRMEEGLPVLTFGYLRSVGNRFKLQLLRSTDLNENVEILSSLDHFIPDSSEIPFSFLDEGAPQGYAFYQLVVTRR